MGNGTFSLLTGGQTIVNSSQLTTINIPFVLNWDDFGDMLYKISSATNVTLGDNSIMFQTYTDERPT